MTAFYKNSLFLATLEILLLCLMNYFSAYTGTLIRQLVLTAVEVICTTPCSSEDFQGINDQWPLLTNSCPEF